MTLINIPGVCAGEGGGGGDSEVSDRNGQGDILFTSWSPNHDNTLPTLVPEFAARGLG